MIALSENDKYLIEHCGFRKSIELDSGFYFVKGSTNDAILKNELIGEKLAQVFGLNCPKYHYVRINDFGYILSEDLNKKGLFKNIEELGLAKESCKLEDICTLLESKHKLQKDAIIDIIKIYIFDIMFFNHDRDPLNWGIYFDSLGIKAITVLDHESLFQPLLTLKLYHTSKYIYKDIEDFLREAPEDFIHLFRYFYDLITPSYLLEILNEVEIENNITIDKEKIIKIHEDNYNKIGSILAECKNQKL